jgi:hypothetical protein
LNLSPQAPVFVDINQFLTATLSLLFFARSETRAIANRWFDVSPRPNVRHIGQEISMQEDCMRMLLRAGTLALALVGGVDLAVGQNAPSGAGGQEKFNLSQSKEQMVSQGLKSEPVQSSPGYQGEIGSKPPDSLRQKQLPDDVTAQMPETKSYIFIKLPDRILLIDPDTKTVAEIVGAPATTGSQSGASPTNAGAPSR